MTKLIVCILYFLVFKISVAQNLVPDSSFEQNSSCPIFSAELYKSLNWFSPTTTTPDLFNVCSPIIIGGVNIPSNSIGYQNALSGNGYSGIGISVSSGNNGREYVSVKLKDSLLVGQYFCFKMYIVLAETANYATNKLGVYFSNDSIYSATVFLNLNPQIEFNDIITDTINWSSLSANYQAIGGEKYITIGNFRDEANTDSINVGGLSSGRSYYYIDDVSLYPCEAPPPTDSLSVTIPNVYTPNGDGQNDNFSLDIYGINNLKDIDVKIFNRWGQSVKSVKLKVENKTQSQIVLWDGRTTAAAEAPQGTYYYIISYTTINEETFTRKGFLTLFR